MNHGGDIDLLVLNASVAVLTALIGSLLGSVLDWARGWRMRKFRRAQRLAGRFDRRSAVENPRAHNRFHSGRSRFGQALFDYWGVFLFAAVLAGALAYDIYRSPWPAWTAIKHRLAAPNCAAARSVGLAPSRRGEPGYYGRHDADADGLSCEPYPRR